MFNPCEYCYDMPIDGSCSKGRCDTCKSRFSCHRRLSATIRITRKCTQSCEHCCFSCSPKENDVMTYDVAKKVNDFLIANKVERLNITGGEVWLNPEWRDILYLFNGFGRKIRIVTNGDFIYSADVKEEFPNFIAYLNDINKRDMYLAISNDKWHKPLNIKLLTDVLDSVQNLPYVIEGIDGQPTVTEDGLVPIGRAELESSSHFYTIQTYCSNPAFRYSFMIDEVGEIFKCPFGIWNIGNVSQYDKINSFFPRFKEFYSSFWKIRPFTCASCIRQHARLANSQNNNNDK